MKAILRGLLAGMALVLTGLSTARAHDAWVETNVDRVPPGERGVVQVWLMLGNHGNEHRDFRMAGKVSLDGSRLYLHGPGGGRRNLKPRLADNGLTEKEGFWSTRLEPVHPGGYTLAYTFDAVASYAPKRLRKSAKAFFKVGEAKGAMAVLGHRLELVPLVDPTSLKAGGRLPVRVLWKGRPVEGARVSAIPRGVMLASGFDPRHEARTNAQGVALLPLPEANLYLVVTHRYAPEETGRRYPQGTSYGATLTVHVSR